jgi:hypothetical protein
MTTNMKNVSVDLETWGTVAGSDIRSIGAFLFDPYDVVNAHTQDNTFYIACENPLLGLYSSDRYLQKELDFLDGPYRRYNLNRDPRTVNWWHNLIASSKDVDYEDAFSNPIDLKLSLIKFSDFLFSISEDVRDGVVHDILIWTHGPAFDPPILEAVYIACGLKYPLFYRSPRDTRTVYDDAGIEDHTAHLKKFNTGPLHHALWDSVSQGKAIADAKNRIRTFREAYENVNSERFRMMQKVFK